MRARSATPRSRSRSREPLPFPPSAHSHTFLQAHRRGSRDMHHEAAPSPCTTPPLPLLLPEPPSVMRPQQPPVLLPPCLLRAQ